MKYSIEYSRKFQRDLKKCYKRGLDIEKLRNVINKLAETGTVPAEYRPHKLSGRFKRAWECHIEPDWLLVWEQNDTELILLLLQTGTHSDIF